jgi:hypothetical protein
MKNLRILPLLLFLVLLFRCDLIDEIRGIDDFEIPVELRGSIPVSVEADDPDNLINESFTYNAQTNPDVADNLEYIDSHNITRIWITVSNYVADSDDIVFDGTVLIEGVSINLSGANSFTPSEHVMPGGQILEVDLNPTAVSTLNQKLKDNDGILSGQVTGSVSDKPVSFTINIYIEDTISGEVT